MAMRSEVLRTPDWLRVEIRHDPRDFTHRLDVGVRCKDGWAHLVSLEVDQANYVDVGFDKKLRVLQRHHEFVTKKLATETLENT